MQLLIHVCYGWAGQLGSPLWPPKADEGWRGGDLTMAFIWPRLAFGGLVQSMALSALAVSHLHGIRSEKRIPGLICLFCILMFCCRAGSATPLCVIGTVADYVTLGAGGCVDYGLTISNVSYSALPGTLTIPASDITMSLSGVGSLLDLDLVSPDFNLTGSETASFMLSYTFSDPAKIIGLFNVVGSTLNSALGEFSSVACVGAAFSPTCPDTTDTITATSFPGYAGVSFPQVLVLGVQDTIQISGSGEQVPGSFDGFGQIVNVPEPSTALPFVLLLLVTFGQRLFRAHFIGQNARGIVGSELMLAPTCTAACSTPANASISSTWHGRIWRADALPRNGATHRLNAAGRGWLDGAGRRSHRRFRATARESNCPTGGAPS